MVALKAETGSFETKEQKNIVRLYQPDLSGNERNYVLECIDSSWISSAGTFVNRFEKAFSETVGVRHAIAVSNGTVALHLALHALGIGPGDEVIVPTLTYVASVNAIAQTGATPIFVDCRRDDWLMDPVEIEKKINACTKAIMAVHLYGAVCDMIAIDKLAKHSGLIVIEDAAESVGCTLDGKHSGTFGAAGVFSFFGNKTITTGEGGMVVTDDSELADRLRLLKGQGQSPDRRYWHIERGFNYRMTNICAAIGLAQIERFPSILARKQLVARMYRERLEQLPVVLQNRAANVESSEWLVSLVLPSRVDRDTVMRSMEADGIETRPVFHCVHEMPMYVGSQCFPVSDSVSQYGISLPSYPQMTSREVDLVVDALRVAITRSKL